MTRLLLTAVVSLFLCSCTLSPSHTDSQPINHVVLIWLKDSGNEQHRQQVIAASQELEKIPGVIKIQAGDVIASERKVVDDSFDVGVHMLFKDQAAMHSYTSHADHVDIVKTRVVPLAEKIVIYDF
ncbi:Dabb family protein [Pseudomonadota bacterium]